MVKRWKQVGKNHIHDFINEKNIIPVMVKVVPKHQLPAKQVLYLDFIYLLTDFNLNVLNNLKRV